jgi:quinol monooxygenase YgiN
MLPKASRIGRLVLVATYLTREELSIHPGAAGRFENAVEAYFALLRQQSPLLRATLLNSLGLPQRYTILEQWHSRDAARAFARGPALAEFAGDAGWWGLAQPSRPVEAYELVHRVIGAGEPASAYLIDEVVGPGEGSLEAFEQSRGEVYRLRQAHGPGFAASLLSRFLGGARRYLIFGGFVAPGDDVRTAQTPEIRQFWSEHPREEKIVVSAIRDPQALVMSARAEPV